MRLLGQQLVSPQCATPTEVVRYMGAMQAQEYRMMRWAVAMRTKSPSMAAFERAFDSGEIVRLHLMRGTWQLVSAEDYWWMLQLCAPKAIAVIQGWMRAGGIEISPTEHAHIASILAQTAADKGSVTKEDFVEALAKRDIRMDDHRLSYHIRMAELSGLLCSGKHHPSKATYSLTANKIPQRAPLERDEALRLLARKYFVSRSPATFEDFVWWSGLNVSDCRRAITLLGEELQPLRLQGRDFLMHTSSRTRGYRSGRTLLVAPYDEYLISYKSRDVVLAAEHRHRAHNNSGIFQPIIVHDGRVCGNWKPFSKSLQYEIFAPTATEPAIDEAWQAYQRFVKR